MDIPLDEVLHFDAITSTPSTGAAVDADAAPTFAVYEEATDTDIGVGGNMTKRTSLTGNYRGTFTLSAANGFEVGKWYNVIGSGVVGGVTGKAVLKSFRVVAAESVVGTPKADMSALGGVAQSATDLKDFADDGYDPSTNKVQGVVLVDTTTDLTNLPTIPANWLTAAGTAADFSTELRTAINGGDYALSTDANGRIRIVDGTGAGELDTSSGSVSVFDFTAAAKALLQTEAEDALVAHRLDELLNADSDIDGAAPPTVGSVFHELMTKTAGSFTFDQTTDSLEALRDRGDAAWITATGFSTHSAADVWAAGTRTLTGLGFTLAAADLAADTITAAKVAADVSTEIRNAITGGAYALDTDANGRVRVVDGTGAGELDTTSGGVLVAALAAQAKADVNAEVVDALNVDTYAEQGQGTPAATASLVVKLGWLYMAFRNKITQTATEQDLFADDGTTVVAKSTVSDDATTFTKSEFVTGP